MNDNALARQIAAQMAILHRATKKLCELQAEAASRAHIAGHIDADTLEAAVAPKDD
jgi:hypothetical protein